jgi:hypothetical protein
MSFASALLVVYVAASLPESKFEALRGPVLIALGVLVGFGGNIASLYVLR